MQIELWQKKTILIQVKQNVAAFYKPLIPVFFSQQSKYLSTALISSNRQTFRCGEVLDRHTAINEKNMKCFKLILMTFLLYGCHATSWFTVHLLLLYFLLLSSWRGKPFNLCLSFGACNSRIVPFTKTQYADCSVMGKESRRQQHRLEDVFAHFSPCSSSSSVIPETSRGTTSPSRPFTSKPGRTPEASLQLQGSYEPVGGILAPSRASDSAHQHGKDCHQLDAHHK